MDIGVNHRDLGEFNVTDLAETVCNFHPDTWNVNDLRQKTFDVHNDTKSIILTFVEGWPNMKQSVHSGWTLLSHVVMPVANEIINKKYKPGGTILRSMVANLVAGGSIPRHYDAAPSFEVAHRIHVPLQTNDNVRFILGDERVVMKVGRAYEVNNILEHEVHNEGDQDRYHMIFDYMPPKKK